MRNRTGLFVIGVAVVTLAAGPAAGQADKIDPAGKMNPTLPVAFFTNSPAPPASPKTENSVYLRPNLKQFVYVFVYNPAEADKTVHVTLFDGPTRAGVVIAKTAAPVFVPGKGYKRVPLAAATAVATAPVPPPAADGKPVAVAAPVGGLVRADELTLHTDVIGDDNKPAAGLVTDNTRPVAVRSPNEYVVETAVEQAAGGFGVVFTFNKEFLPFSDAPSRVRLDLRADANDDLKKTAADRQAWKGAFEADMQFGKETAAVLSVTGMKMANAAATAVVGVTIDGCDRAFLYETKFTDTPNKFEKKALAIRPSAAVVKSGDPHPVRVEILNPVTKFGTPNDLLRLGVSADGGTQRVLKEYPTPVRKEAYVTAGGPDDALVFTTILKDWVYDFPTTGVVGRITFTADAPGGYTSGRGTLVIDDTRPTDVAVTKVPEKGPYLGTTVTVEAAGKDDISGIEDVLFYLGSPPGADGKPAGGGKVVKGTFVSGDKLGVKTYKATFRMPETKGEVAVGVRFVNGVGLTTDADEKTLYVVPEPEKEKPKDKLGTIEGTVVQGSRPQSLPVVLRDAAGKVVDSVESEKGTGKYAFKDVPPGFYAISSEKKTDGAVGATKKPIKVEAGKTTKDVEINVLR